MSTSNNSDFVSENLLDIHVQNDLSIFNEVSESLKILNEQHRILHTVIKDMISEYHIYHILSEKCQEIAIENPHTYFESLYNKLSLLKDLEFKD